MVSGGSTNPFNDGRAVIVCLAQRSNTLDAIAALLAAATVPRVTFDPHLEVTRPLTCEEAIPLIGNAAQAGRASDPILVERLGRLACDGRLVALDQPAIYIHAVELTRLRTPGGDPVTEEWLRFDRALGPAAPDETPRWQRLTIEAPPDSSLCVSDLIDVATEQAIRHGGQVADLVDVALALRVSDSGVHDAGHMTVTPEVDISDRCADIHHLVGTPETPPAGTGPTPRDRERSGLPQGIAYRSGQQPAPYFRLLLLNAHPRAAANGVSEALSQISAMLANLQQGDVRDLRGQPAFMARPTEAMFEGFEFLLGYGRRYFDHDLHQPPLTSHARPDYLSYLPTDGPFPALRWENPTGGNPGETDFALQFTAQHQAAVNCAAVEVWKLIVDSDLPLECATTYDGFARLDGRGWLDFHDGVSNMPANQRRFAIEAGPDPAWMDGGTYLTFLRIAIDIGAWRTLNRRQQELLIGRDKSSGAGLVGTTGDDRGKVEPVAGRSFEDPADADALSDFMDPPAATDPHLERSHLHRANQHRGSPYAKAALRIFRQGYEFLDQLSGAPSLGLNFVSFQRDLATIHHLLHLPGWLGDVDLGGQPHCAQTGPANHGERSFATVESGGLYALSPSRR